MTRSSPSVARVVAILNFMAEHPGEAFTLTDFVRALKLSRATCHALLAGLVDAHYLYRASDKSYVLGPALITIGRVADEHLSPLRIAQPEMRALADEFDAVCSAVFREGNEIIVRERSESRSSLGSVARGTRLPFKLPAATNFVSWAPREEADAFIGQIMPEASSDYLAEIHAGIDFTRALGFQILLYKEGGARRPVSWLLEKPQSESPIRVATALAEDEEYLLASLTAPVFDAGGQVTFMLGLMGFVGSMTGAEILHMGGRLRDACNRISGFVGGRAP